MQFVDWLPPRTPSRHNTPNTVNRRRKVVKVRRGSTQTAFTSSTSQPPAQTASASSSSQSQPQTPLGVWQWSEQQETATTVRQSITASTQTDPQPSTVHAGTQTDSQPSTVDADTQTDPQTSTVETDTQAVSDEHVEAVPANFKSVTILDRLASVLGGFGVFVVSLWCLSNLPTSLQTNAT